MQRSVFPFRAGAARLCPPQPWARSSTTPPAAWSDSGDPRLRHPWWAAAQRTGEEQPAKQPPTVAAALPAAEDEELPAQRRRRAEAVLLFHRGPINLRKLATLATLADATEARTRIRELNELYDRTGSALRIEEVGGGHQLLTRPALAPWLRRIRHVPQPIQLGSAAMETLAIIAYRQPVLRAEIEAIRGVACGELVRQLMQRDLVRIRGRSEELGRPYLYGTTPYFLQVFGLKNAESLPAVSGASVQDDSEDTLANLDDPNHATALDSPIEPPGTVTERSAYGHKSSSASPPFDAVTPKESDVSIAPGPVVFDEAADLLTLPSHAVATLPAAPSGARAVIDDEDEDYFDDSDDDEDDDEDDVWEDDEDDELDDDEDEDDEDEDDEWKEVGDEDEDDDEDDELKDDDEEDDEVDDLLSDDDEEDDVWSDDEDEDWEEDDEDEEWD